MILYVYQLMETAMTAYTRQDLIDSFYCSASLNDPEPTDAQIDQLLELSLERYGKHPVELETRYVDDMVYEIVKGHPVEELDDFNYVGSRHHY